MAQFGLRECENIPMSTWFLFEDLFFI